MQQNSSWKTTLVGALGAGFLSALPVLQTGEFNIHRDWPYIVGAAGSAFFGYFSKDSDKTGLPK